MPSSTTSQRSRTQAIRDQILPRAAASCSGRSALISYRITDDVVEIVAFIPAARHVTRFLRYREKR